MTAELKRKVVVITGAGSGIGKAIAMEIAKLGPAMCLVGRKEEKLRVVAEALSRNCSQVFCYPCDLAVEENIQDVSERIIGVRNRVDILIHSAGAFAFGPLETTTADEFDSLYRINVRAPYLLTRALLPLIKSSKGEIVFVNSSAGLSANANVGAYAATKHALKAIADSLRQEVNSWGVRVFSIYPGRTATPMQAEVHKMEDKIYHPENLLQARDVAKTVLNVISLPRTAEVTDLNIRPMLKS